MKPIRPATEQLWVGTSDAGKQLVLQSEIDGLVSDLITILADDENDSQWIQLELYGELVQIPISVVSSMIEAARTEVHSEKWYEENVYPKTIE